MSKITIERSVMETLMSQSYVEGAKFVQSMIDEFPIEELGLKASKEIIDKLIEKSKDEKDE